MRLLLFSGGIESTCLAILHRPDVLLTVDYGQACAEGELRAANHIARRLTLRHETVRAPLAHLGAGDLAASAPATGGEATEFWPYRNQMLVTLAAMRFEREGLREILIGTIQSDQIHADGTPEFVDAISAALTSQNSGLSLIAPAISYTTEQVVRASGISNEMLGWTFSCHRSNVACGVCRGCNKSIAVLRAMGHPNTALYAARL